MKNAHSIDTKSLVDLILHLKWKSNLATHTDGYQASRVNIWQGPGGHTRRDEIPFRRDFVFLA